MRDFFNKLFTTLIITTLVFYVSCVFITQENKLNSLKTQKEQCQASIDEALMENEKLNEDRGRIHTDEYKEEYAREKYGLVMPYEIIFVDASV